MMCFTHKYNTQIYHANMLFSGQNKLKDIQNFKLEINGKHVYQVGNNCKEKYFNFFGHVLDENLTC